MVEVASIRKDHRTESRVPEEAQMVNAQVMWNPDNNKRDLYIVIYDIPGELQTEQVEVVRQLARSIEVSVRKEGLCETSTS